MAQKVAAKASSIQILGSEAWRVCESAALGGSKNLEKSRSEASWRRKLSKMLASRPPDVEKCSKMLASRPSDVEKSSKMLAPKPPDVENSSKMLAPKPPDVENRRKCSLRSLCDFENNVWRRAGDQKTDRRARLEATLLEDAQLRAFHARVHTSISYLSQTILDFLPKYQNFFNFLIFGGPF